MRGEGRWCYWREENQRRPLVKDRYRTSSMKLWEQCWSSGGDFGKGESFHDDKIHVIEWMAILINSNNQKEAVHPQAGLNGGYTRPGPAREYPSPEGVG
jgi:hypothetical protein